MIGTRRRLALLATTLSVLLLTGACASLPESSSPQAIGTLATAVPGTSVESPASGREPDLLVRDFVKASTDPSNRHAAARQYLTKTLRRVGTTRQVLSSSTRSMCSRFLEPAPKPSTRFV